MLCIRSNFVNKILINISIFIMVLALAFFLSFFSFYNDIDRKKSLDKMYVEELYWGFIEAEIKDNTYFASKLNVNLKNQFEKELLTYYKDNLPQLKIDLDSIDEENFVSNLMYQYIEESSFRDIKGNSASLFFITPSGVVSTSSEEQYFIKVLKSQQKLDIPESEAKNIYNKDLLENAIKDISNNAEDKYIFWEPISSANNQHIKIKKVSLKEMKEVFLAEGFEGIKDYEFLIPSYITRTGDVFGISDVTATGIPVKNHKIIIVQKFKLSSIIKLYHSDKIMLYQNKLDKIDLEAKQKKTDLMITSSIILLIFILLYVRIYTYQKGFSDKNNIDNNKNILLLSQVKEDEDFEEEDLGGNK